MTAHKPVFPGQGCDFCKSKVIVKHYGPVKVCQKHEDRIRAVVADSQARTREQRLSQGVA